MVNTVQLMTYAILNGNTENDDDWSGRHSEKECGSKIEWIFSNQSIVIEPFLLRGPGYALNTEIMYMIWKGKNTL